MRAIAPLQTSSLLLGIGMTIAEPLLLKLVAFKPDLIQNIYILLTIMWLGKRFENLEYKCS